MRELSESKPSKKELSQVTVQKVLSSMINQNADFENPKAQIQYKFNREISRRKQ